MLSKEYTALVQRVDGLDGRIADLDFGIARLKDRMYAVEKAMVQLSETQSNMQVTQTKITQVTESQQAILGKLTDKLDKLLQSDAVVSRRGDATVLDKNRTYSEFGRCGVTPRTAMVTLDRAGLILKDKYGNRTVPVRIGNRICRAVVIIKGGKV